MRQRDTPWTRAHLNLRNQLRARTERHDRYRTAAPCADEEPLVRRVENYAHGTSLFSQLQHLSRARGLRNSCRIDRAIKLPGDVCGFPIGSKRHIARPLANAHRLDHVE